MGVVSGQVLLSRLPGYALNGTPLAKDVPSIRLTRTTDMQTVEFPDGSQQVFMSRPIKDQSIRITEGCRLLRRPPSRGMVVGGVVRPCMKPPLRHLSPVLLLAALSMMVWES